MLLFPSFLAGQVLRLEENVLSHERGHHGAQELSLAPIKERAPAREQEGEFVHSPKATAMSGMVRMVALALAFMRWRARRSLGFWKFLHAGNLVKERPSRPQKEGYVGVEQEVVGGFEVADVLVSGLGGGLVAWSVG